MRGLTLELAGIRLGFDVPDRALRGRLEARYRHFLVGSDASHRIAVETFPPAPDRTPRPILPKVESAPGRLWFSRGDAEGALDPRSLSGRLRIWPNPYSFDAALRVVYSELFAKRGAFFLHAASLADRGGACVFPGPSGAGKTTLAASCPELELLGDELALVLPRGAGFEVRSTPFRGEGRRARSGETGRSLRGLFFLERRSGPRILPLEPVVAQKLALKCLVWFSDGDGGRLGSLWGEVLRLVKKVPAYRLSFQKGVSPWPQIKETLS